MNKKQFAYLLFTCSHSEAIEFDWSDWSPSDIFAAFIESEEQAEVPADLWTFDWEEDMDRVAPVQLTLGWDPRPYMLDILQSCGIEPLYRHGGYRSEDVDQIIYFDHLPDALQLETFMASSLSEAVINPGDKTRFDEVLQCTMALSRSQNRGTLFIGAQGAGQPYDEDFLFEVEHVLRAANMKFFTRHEKNVTNSRHNASHSTNNGMAEALLGGKALEKQEKCIDHLKQICTATLMYAQDNDDYLPNAEEWCDEIAVYHSSSDGILSCPATDLPWGYAMNLNLSGVNTATIKEPHRTVLFYESSFGTINVQGVGDSLPQPSRHLGGDVFAFADGHVEVIDKESQNELAMKWTGE